MIKYNLQDHITHDWTRNYSKLSQPNVLRRIPSHTVNDREEYDEDFDHLADAEELERRAAFRRDKGNEEEEDDFGDFESANNEQSFETITNHMETLDMNKTKNDEHLVRAIKTKEEEEEQHLKQKQRDLHFVADEQEGEI